LLSAVSLRSQIFTPEELQILKYQDERTFGKNNELFTYLDNRNDAVVTRALWAIGNIGNKDGINVVAEKLFSGHSDEIRLAAAYSLGLLPFDESRKSLAEALSTEKNAAILCEILNSLGYIGDKENYEDVVSYKTDSEELRTYLAVSIARFARRNIKSEKGVEKLIELSSGKNERTLRLVSYALSNMRSKELLSPAKDLISSLLKSNDPDTRMWSYLANGYVSGPDEVKSILNAYETESVWQVKVNMLNSLQAINRFNPELSDNTGLAEFLVNKGQGEDVYLSTTALKVLGNVFKLTKNETLKSTLLPQLEWFMTKGKAVDLPSIAEAVNTMGMIYKDKAKDELISYYNDVEGFELKEAVISSFKYFDNASVAGTMRDMITKDVQAYVNKNKIESGDMIAGKELNGLYSAYVETLSELKYKANEKDRNTFRLIFSEFISSKDPSIIDVCITSLSDSIFAYKLSETQTILALDYQDLVYPKDKESMRLFIRAMGNLGVSNAVELLTRELQHADYEIAKESADALKKITGKDYTFNAKKKYITNIEDINSLINKSYAILQTTQGNIKIKLYPYFAPFSVLNFVNLAEKGYFNNTVFHRVIPNFVIQGGDPLNNGWGGPEYSIRSEFAPLHYERGIFGMASDGKDTEGSQFFITHSPFYHLDNAYTIFGEVIDGMEIADVIYIGDVLLNVVIVSQ
jgi:cyclophilin family peptidyl-prolyl cis-trans isomerase/HEAT repeat protein